MSTEGIYNQAPDVSLRSSSHLLAISMNIYPVVGKPNAQWFVRVPLDYVDQN